jgi:arylsulfatase A-like enzyme
VTPARSANFAHAIDFFPTIAAAAGVDVPEILPGINLLDADARSSRQRVFGVTHSTHNMTPGDPSGTLQYLWCVEEEWKLILRQHGEDTTKYKSLQLTNLVSTPNPRNSLSGRVTTKYGMSP